LPYLLVYLVPVYDKGIHLHILGRSEKKATPVKLSKWHVVVQIAEKCRASGIKRHVGIYGGNAKKQTQLSLESKARGLKLVLQGLYLYRVVQRQTIESGNSVAPR